VVHCGINVTVFTAPILENALQYGRSLIGQDEPDSTFAGVRQEYGI